jgi:hypothetical protein
MLDDHVKQDGTPGNAFDLGLSSPVVHFFFAFSTFVFVTQLLFFAVMRG